MFPQRVAWQVASEVWQISCQVGGLFWLGKCRTWAIPTTQKGLWLGELQAYTNLAPDVAGKGVFKTKIEISFLNFEKYFENFQRIWRNISEIFKNYLEKFWELSYFKKSEQFFWKTSRSISKSCKKYLLSKFLKI